MIFYQIQAAHNIHYVATLISLIYNEENFYLITIDKAQAAAADDLRQSFAKFSNIAVTSEYNITWGGFSQVQSAIFSIKYALRFPNLKYYMNLSDSDLPLWTQEQLKEFFERSILSQHLIYIQHWRPEIDFDEIILLQEAGTSSLEHRDDIHFNIDNSIRKYFESGETSPITHPRLRVLLNSREQADQKTLRISPLTLGRKQDRSEFCRTFTIYVGRQWFAAHLDILRFVLSHPKFSRFYEMFKDVFIPDEIFFQTAILNLIENAEVIANDNLRFVQGDPVEVSDQNLDEVFGSPAAFARKLDLQSAGQLLTRAKAKFVREVEAFTAVDPDLAASLSEIELTRSSRTAPAAAEKSSGCRSFDLFDTLLTRRCVHPHGVIEEIERRSGIADFCRLRLGVERALFDRGEYTFHQIYEQLGDELGLSADEVARLKALELSVERENFIQIKEHCLEIGPNDIVVSDMYLPREFLEDVLREVCGIEGRPLYLSSHGKRSGTVWTAITQAHDVIEHVGDNPTTDEASARAAGIPSRLTSVTHPTDTETELADLGFVPLANLIREARLSTWHPEPALRRAQLAQLDVNLPLLFFATGCLLQRALERDWRKILFSARDCYLWSRLYQSLVECGACNLSAAYFYTSRVARSRSSGDYMRYFNALRRDEKAVVVDLCGTGWSAARLAERAGTADTEFFLLHHLDAPELRQAYEDFAGTASSVPIFSMLRRGAEGQDNDVFEELNRAPHRMVADVVQRENGFHPVYRGEHYRGLAAAIFVAHHEAFLLACQKFCHIPRGALRAMLEMNVEDQFVRLYRRLPELIDDIAPLMSAKAAEEDLVWPELKATG